MLAGMRCLLFPLWRFFLNNVDRVDCTDMGTRGRSNHRVNFKKYKPDHVISCLFLYGSITFSTHPMLFIHQPSLPCTPASLALSAVGALALPLGVASLVLHVASSVSTAKSDFKNDKILGSPSPTLVGSHCRGPNPALWSSMWQEVTDVRQITEITWQ